MRFNSAQPFSSAGSRHPVTHQDLNDSIHVEVFHRQAEVVDARRTRARVGERQEVRSVADAQEGRRPVTRLDGQAEEPLVKLQRALPIRYGERYMVQPSNTKPSGLHLCEHAAGKG